jgi:hypothetical protein
MARRVFFSFHYDEDIWRANQVRNSWVTKENEANIPIDHASWEAIKKKGDDEVKKWINNQLSGAGVTAVLIGSYTSTRKFVLYELEKSWELKKGIVGVRIHNLKNQEQKTSSYGTNPLDVVKVQKDLFPGSNYKTTVALSSIFKTYDWIQNDGYSNFKNWVEEAATLAGR